MKKLNLTDYQKYELCHLIGEWYLEWKEKISNCQCGEKQHRLGFAKEQLKTLLTEEEKDQKILVCPSYEKHSSPPSNAKLMDCPTCSFKMWVSEKKERTEGYLICYDCIEESLKNGFFDGDKEYNFIF